MELALSGRLEIETCPAEPRKGLQSYLIFAEEERRKPELAWGRQLTENDRECSVTEKTVCRLNCNVPLDGWIPDCPWGPEPLCCPCWARAQQQLPTRTERHSSEEPTTLLLCCVPSGANLYLSLFFPELELVFFSRRMKMVIMWRLSNWKPV